MDKYSIDGHKLCWHLDRVKEWQEERIIPPIYIEVSPVSFCNHKCIFCGLDFAMKEKHRLETEVFCKRLKELGKLGTRSIMFAGEGEPLLHKDLPKFVSVAKDAGIDVSITTNGSLDNYSLWADILSQLTWIRFSVDAGTAKTHALVHRVPEICFDKTINSIESSVKIKNDYNLDVTIGIQFLIIEENLSDLENALNLFTKIKVDYISLKPYSLHPQMAKKKSIIYTRETISYIENVLHKYKNKAGTDIIFRKDAMEKYMLRKKRFNHCRALPFWGYISSRGDFYTCSVFLGDERFKAGNIYREDMQSIMFSDKRRNSIHLGEKDLDIENKCRLNCRMARINEFLELLGDKPEHINFV